MRNNTVPFAVYAALAGIAILGAGTESQAANYSRKSPIVEAVQKTRDSIVTIKVDKRGPSGRKEVVGTGVVVDERGYIVTNRHVVNNAERVTVQFADRSSLSAKVHTEDANHDLAILRVVTTEPLKALHFGPGSDLMVGEMVIVVGNPFGYTNTVSTGIISALGREVSMGSVRLSNLIQTDASINPGNSGGPVLNINGELIGIAVAIREGAQGISFALNADTVQEVLSKHLSASRVARLGHGLSLREAVLPEGTVRQQVVIEDVAEKSAAAKAGLKSGDVIAKLGERPVANRFDVERALWSCKPGDEVAATVVRDGKATQVSLKLTRSGETTTVAKKNTKSRGRNGDTHTRVVSDR